MDVLVKFGEFVTVVSNSVGDASLIACVAVVGIGMFFGLMSEEPDNLNHNQPEHG